MTIKTINALRKTHKSVNALTQVHHSWIDPLDFVIKSVVDFFAVVGKVGYDVFDLIGKISAAIFEATVYNFNESNPPDDQTLRELDESLTRMMGYGHTILKTEYQGIVNGRHTYLILFYNVYAKRTTSITMQYGPKLTINTTVLQETVYEIIDGLGDSFTGDLTMPLKDTAIPKLHVYEKVKTQFMEHGLLPKSVC